MPTRVGTTDRTILIVCGVVMAALAAISFAIAPVDSSPDLPGSSFSTESSGTRAAYLVLQELGHDIVRSFEPITSLAFDPATTTLVLANPMDSPSKGDQQSIVSFIRQGGIVIAYGPSAAAFLPGVSPRPPRTHESELEAFPAALPGPLTRGAREVSAHRYPRPGLDSSYVPVYGSHENPAVVTSRLGDGQVIWCVDEAPVQNDGIARAGNVTLMSNAAGAPQARTIAWDEYYHGQRRSLWSYVARTPLVWGGVQLGIVAAAVLAGVSRRRGPLRAKFVEPRTSPLEFVDTVASLYERAGDARSAVDSVRQRLRRRLAVALTLSTASVDEQVANAAPRVGLDPDRTRAALALSRDALRRGIDSKEAVGIIAELQELARSVRGPRGASR